MQRFQKTSLSVILYLCLWIQLTMFSRSQDSLLVERLTHDRKVASSNPGRSSGRIFFSRINFVGCLLFGVCSNHVLLQWHAKDPGHSAKKCRWQVTPKYTYTLDPMQPEWADYAAVQALPGNLSGNELTRNSSGNTRLQPSQLAEPLWTDPGLKSGISVRKLISTKKKKKKCRWGMNC